MFAFSCFLRAIHMAAAGCWSTSPGPVFSSDTSHYPTAVSRRLFALVPITCYSPATPQAEGWGLKGDFKRLGTVLQSSAGFSFRHGSLEDIPGCFLSHSKGCISSLWRSLVPAEHNRKQLQQSSSGVQETETLQKLWATWVAQKMWPKCRCKDELAQTHAISLLFIFLLITEDLTHHVECSEGLVYTGNMRCFVSHPEAGW